MRLLFEYVNKCEMRSVCVTRPHWSIVGWFIINRQPLVKNVLYARVDNLRFVSKLYICVCVLNVL